MGKTTVQAPATPNYQDSYANGVQADIAALPLRNAINAASTLGTSYTDPKTGQVYDFTGLGSQDIASAQLQQQLKDAPAAAAALLQIQQQYGPEFAKAARESLQATDPTGFALREQFGQQLADGGGLESLLSSISTPSLESYQGNGPAQRTLADSDLPTFAWLANINLADTGAAAAGRSALETQIFDELNKVGTLDPALQRAAEQAARARGASSGNLYGDGAALNEALKVQLAQKESDASRRNNALALLESGQTTSDKGNALAQQNFNNAGTTASFNNAAAQQGFQNKGAVVDQNNTAANTAFQNAMTAINQRNQVAQNNFANQQSLVQQRIGARQQDTANVQSYLGLTPIVSQGAQLSGLQQGAAPVATGTGYQAVGTNAGAGQAGASFAGNIFGTQSSNYQSQMANSSNPFGALAGSFLGAATGGAGSAAGTALGKKLFG